MSTTRTKLYLALAATALLAIAAGSTVVEARPGSGPSDGGAHRADNSTAARDCSRAPDPAQCEKRVENAQEMREKRQEKCNPPANETAEKQCKAAKEVAKKGLKARREANALIHAIAAHEAILGKLEYKIAKVQQKLNDGNLTVNQTAELHKRLDRLEAMHDRQVAKIDELQAKLDGLKAKWAEVRDHVKERRERHQSDGADDDESEPTSTTTSTTASTTSSTTSSSTSGA